MPQHVQRQTRKQRAALKERNTRRSGGDMGTSHFSLLNISSAVSRVICYANTQDRSAFLPFTFGEISTEAKSTRLARWLGSSWWPLSQPPPHLPSGEEMRAVLVSTLYTRIHIAGFLDALNAMLATTMGRLHILFANRAASRPHNVLLRWNLQRFSA